jgi:hypothetical protein
MAPDGGGVTLDGGDARVALDGENLNVPINMKHVSQWYFFSPLSTDVTKHFATFFDAANIIFRCCRCCVLMLNILILDVTNCGPHRPDGALRPDVRVLTTPIYF